MRSRIFVVVGLAVFLTSCASSKPEESFEMAISADSLSVQLSRDMVVGLLEDGLDTTLDCNTEPDDELRELFEPLARKRYASSTIGEGDDRIVARRRGSTLYLTIGDRHAGHIRAKMSWGIAECLLGRDTTLEEALGNGKYCSRKCYRADPTKDLTVERTCEQCGNVFRMYKSQLRYNAGKFCSRQCYKTSLNTKE